ncbi:MAG: protein kinase domain-containing protein [Pirellulales bacterium]
MANKPRNLESLFLSVLEIESPQEREAFLARACGDDVALRNEIDQLLASHQVAGSFLDKPAPELKATVMHDTAGKDLAASFEAGLSPAFREGEAVVIGSAGHSVLKSLGQALGKVPQVALRDAAQEASEPIVRPKSPELPSRDSDSRYRLDGEIARGGIGAILKGRDTDLGRDLAIKVLLDVHKDKPEVVQRFIEEAQIGGQLQHPGITPVYELGQFADRRPFFSMKLVKGQTLSKLLAEREAPTEDRGRFLGIFEQVCQTMAYAHSRGVIHRDLKPANIMVGAFGEVQVMDWGLAKVLPVGGVADEKKSRLKQQGQSIIQTLRSGIGSDAADVGSVGSHTQMGSVMGTPAYMPPEQALGEIDQLDERADVFGLGAILCEILTGKPPYTGDDGTLVLRLATRGKLGDCFERLDACGADAELIALAKHCLELEPNDRPRDAGALAERVTVYLESVEARLRQTELERAAEAARDAEQRRRRRILMTASGVIALVFLAGFAGVFWQWRVAETARADEKSQRDRAESEKAKALAAEEEGRKLLYTTDMQLAPFLWKDDRSTATQLRMILAKQIPDRNAAARPDLRGFEWYYYQHLLENSAAVFSGHETALAAGTLASEGQLVTLDANGQVRRWDVDSQSEDEAKRRDLPGGLSAQVRVLSPVGRLAALAEADKVRVFDTSMGKETFQIDSADDRFRRLLF